MSARGICKEHLTVLWLGTRLYEHITPHRNRSNEFTCERTNLRWRKTILGIKRQLPSGLYFRNRLNITLERNSALEYRLGDGSFQWRRRFTGVRRLEIRWPIETKFDTIDWVYETSRQNKFCGDHPLFHHPNEVNSSFANFVFNFSVIISPTAQKSPPVLMADSSNNATGCVQMSIFGSECCRRELNS